MFGLFNNFEPLKTDRTVFLTYFGKKMFPCRIIWLSTNLIKKNTPAIRLKMV